MRDAGDVTKPSSNAVWHPIGVTRRDRERRNEHRGVVLWFTGLPGAGKSTLAHAVEQRLFAQGCRTFVLDGDNVRHGLCADLGFSAAERAENVRRIGELARLFVEAGVITLAAFISPFAADRARPRSLFASGDFLEIYCECPLAVCEARDPKGMYRRARAGEIAGFTGVSAPYEVPEHPELTVNTAQHPLDGCVAQVLGLAHEAIAPRAGQ
jgi:adenylylsulfate kinase